MQGGGDDDGDEGDEGEDGDEGEEEGYEEAEPEAGLEMIAVSMSCCSVTLWCRWHAASALQQLAGQVLQAVLTPSITHQQDGKQVSCPQKHGRD